MDKKITEMADILSCKDKNMFIRFLLILSGFVAAVYMFQAAFINLTMASSGGLAGIMKAAGISYVWVYPSWITMLTGMIMLGFGVLFAGASGVALFKIRK